MKNVIFIIGADRSGKSTLARNFIDSGYMYVHFDKPKRSPYEEYLDFYHQISRAKTENWIVDRYIWCEYAYSRHYGRQSDCDLTRIRALETKFLDFNSRLVYCSTDLQSNWDRIEEEGKHEFKAIDELDRLRKWYNESVVDTVLPFRIYDFTRGDNFEDLYAGLSLMP